MADESKKTNWFSHDSNARNDEKILKLRMKHGAAGYGIYFMIIERLRDERGYMSVKDYNMLAFDLRVDAGIIKSVVEDFGLFVFTEDGKYLYSESFLRRMDIKDESSKARSEAGKKGAAVRWGTQNSGENMAKPSDDNSNAIAKPSKKIASKVKLSKVKLSKESKGKKDNVCTEPGTDSMPSSDSEAKTIISLPLNDKTHFAISEPQVEQWKELYPAVDVIQELRKMLAWLDANPDRRKTKRGIKAFCVNWLSREQDRGRATPRNANGKISSAIGNFEQREYSDNDLESLIYVPGQEYDK